MVNNRCRDGLAEFVRPPVRWWTAKKERSPTQQLIWISLLPRIFFNALCSVQWRTSSTNMLELPYSFRPLLQPERSIRTVASFSSCVRARLDLAHRFSPLLFRQRQRPAGERERQRVITISSWQTARGINCLLLNRREQSTIFEWIVFSSLHLSAEESILPMNGKHSLPIIA